MQIQELWQELLVSYKKTLCGLMYGTQAKSMLDSCSFSSDTQETSTLYNVVCRYKMPVCVGGPFTFDTMRSLLSLCNSIFQRSCYTEGMLLTIEPITNKNIDVRDFGSGYVNIGVCFNILKTPSSWQQKLKEVKVGVENCLKEMKIAKNGYTVESSLCSLNYETGAGGYILGQEVKILFNKVYSLRLDFCIWSAERRDMIFCTDTFTYALVQKLTKVPYIQEINTSPSINTGERAISCLITYKV